MFLQRTFSRKESSDPGISLLLFRLSLTNSFCLATVSHPMSLYPFLCLFSLFLASLCLHIVIFLLFLLMPTDFTFNLNPRCLCLLTYVCQAVFTWEWCNLGASADFVLNAEFDLNPT